MRAVTLLVVLASLIAAASASAQPVAPKRPNFLVIVADDLGFSDLGAFGGEIATPNLDALASRGLRLTGFHSAPTCSPTRSMLLSGTDNHLAGLGTMAELIAPNQSGKPGHEGYLRADVAALPELLAAGGYRTLMAGKWHLGLTPETDLSKRGFQRSFALLQGGHNHFGRDVSADPAKGSTYRENGRTLDALPADFYSSDYFATKLIQYLAETRAGPDGDKPFFAYLAFTAPHWPLQAPSEAIANYKGRYDGGYEALRAERLQRQAALGLVDRNAAVHPLIFRESDRTWASLSPDERRRQARAMEIYAAMVDRLDQNVGRVVAALKASGEFDNTVVLFLADNGAEGLEVERAPMLARFVEKADNRYEATGSALSYIGYGPGWAQAATAPSRLYKGHATEGGTRVAAFIAAPGGKNPGTVSTAFGTVMDVVPTFLDLAGLPAPRGSFDGRRVQPIRGRSWADLLAGRTSAVHPADEATGWELFGSRALRRGDWKAVHLADGGWQLFDLASDPGETRDLAREQPEKLAEFVRLWEAYAREVGVVLPDQRPSYQP